MIKIFKLHQVAEKNHHFPVGYNVVGSITIKSERKDEDDLETVKEMMSKTSDGKPWYSRPTAYIVHTKARSIKTNDVLEKDGKFFLLQKDGGFAQVSGMNTD